MTPADAADTKAARTRSAIIDAALRLFRERGYDATTMRAIAAEAGVSVGNAYYYFESKEQLVQGFYDRAQVDHAAAARPVLDAEVDLAARIVGVGEAWLQVMEPYRPFAGKFFKNAAEPTSPLSPFSAESTPARAAAIALWEEVLAGSDARIPKRIRAELPELLWLYFMGIVLFWVHDPTADVSATRRVLHRTAPLVVRAIALTRLPVMRTLLDDVVALIHDIRQVFPMADTTEAPAR
ncbi:MAG TPA: TetR family transcriptional regulator [Acidimicrobiia bacterium]|nr:TetR family transcriptional regulator [Acidimicrobiia bacterium]